MLRRDGIKILEKLHKLQELLKEFKPVISRIDRNVEGISKDIEGEYRERCQEGRSHINFRGPGKVSCLLSQWFGDMWTGYTRILKASTEETPRIEVNFFVDNHACL